MQRPIIRFISDDRGFGGPHICDQIESRLRHLEAFRQCVSVLLGQVADVEGLCRVDSGADFAAPLVVYREYMLLQAGLQPGVLRRWCRLGGQIDLVRKIVHQGREGTDDGETGQLQKNEGHNAAIHLDGLDFRWRDAAQIKQRETKGRCQERRLHVDPDHHAQPDGGHVGRRIGEQDRRDDRHHHDGDLDEVEEESEQEDDPHHHDEFGDEAAGQPGQEIAHQILAPEGAESGRQHGGAEQDDEDQGSGLGGFDHHPFQGVFDLEDPPAAPCDRGEKNQGRDRREDNAKDVFAVPDVLDVDVEILEQQGKRDDRNDDQEGRGKSAALALHEAVARHDHGANGANGPRLVDGGDTENDGAEDHEDECQRRRENDEYAPRELRVVLAEMGRRRGRFRPEEGEDENIENVQTDQHEPR